VNASVTRTRQNRWRTHLPAMHRAFSLAAACVALLVSDAAAAPRRIALAPPATEVAFRAYGMGLLPLDGIVTKFRGALLYDPDDQTKCQVELAVDVDSLTMSDSSVRQTVVGPDFMDASRFPMLTFSGDCRSEDLGGLLLMHGISRPFALMLDWSRDRVVAEGRLRRADWGMTAMPIMGGAQSASA
jgi:polyisoprenoid-binding protein YceI